MKKKKYILGRNIYIKMKKKIIIRKQTKMAPERDGNSLCDLPLIDQLVIERISGLSLHNIRLGSFVGQ